MYYTAGLKNISSLTGFPSASKQIFLTKTEPYFWATRTFICSLSTNENLSRLYISLISVNRPRFSFNEARYQNDGAGCFRSGLTEVRGRAQEVCECLYSTRNYFSSSLLAELGALPELSAEVNRRSELCDTELENFSGCSGLAERDKFSTQVLYQRIGLNQ